MQQAIAEHQIEEMKPKGRYVLTLANVDSPEAKEWERRAAAARDRGDKMAAMGWMRRINQKYGCEKITVENLVPIVGRAVLTARLAGTLTYTGTVNKAALGTGSATPANSDTQLTTESYRNNIASATYADNIAYLTAFYTAAECNGTYAEVGLFIDGTASANTGQMFSHALISVTKSAIQTLTIDWVVTLS